MTPGLAQSVGWTVRCLHRLPASAGDGTQPGGGTEQGMEQAACEPPPPGVEAAGPPLSLSPGSTGGPRFADLCSPGSCKRPRTRSSIGSQRPGRSRQTSAPGARLEQSQPSGKRSLGETVQCWMSLPLSRNTYSFLLSWKASLKPTDQESRPPRVVV